MAEDKTGENQISFFVILPSPSGHLSKGLLQNITYSLVSTLNSAAKIASKSLNS